MSTKPSSGGLAIFVNFHSVKRKRLFKSGLLSHVKVRPGICHTPVLVLQLLVQLKLVVDRVHPSRKLLMLPGIGSGDAVGPHGEERDGACGRFNDLWVDRVLLNCKLLSRFVPFALSGGWSSSLDTRGFLLSGSGESGESLITSDSWSSLSSKPFSLNVKSRTHLSYMFSLLIYRDSDTSHLSESCQLFSSVSLLLVFSVLSSLSSLFLPLFLRSSSSGGLLLQAMMQSSTRWCLSVLPACVFTSVSNSFHMMRYCSSLTTTMLQQVIHDAVIISTLFSDLKW